MAITPTRGEAVGRACDILKDAFALSAHNAGISIEPFTSPSSSTTPPQKPGLNHVVYDSYIKYGRALEK